MTGYAARLTALLLALCLLAPVAQATDGANMCVLAPGVYNSAAEVPEEIEVGPMVMSNFRHATFPTPDVPACARVDDAYFDGAVLIGDSVAAGLGTHQLIPQMEVLAEVGLSARTAATDQRFTTGGQPATLVEKLAAEQPSMIYIWLGSNGIDTKDATRVIEDYDRLLNRLLAALPDTPVYLIEATPVKRIASERYAGLTNERVDAFNAMLYEVAKRHNVYLLPVNFLLKGENGLLTPEYGAGDGIHLRKAAYEVLADYLYTHTIPVENTTEGATE